MKDIKPGQKYGKWTVLNPPYIDGPYSTQYVRVKCKCGFIQVTQLHPILEGRSLGCRKCQFRVIRFDRRNRRIYLLHTRDYWTKARLSRKYKLSRQRIGSIIKEEERRGQNRDKKTRQSGELETGG